MADSGITISGLAAVGGVGQVVLTWSVTEASCLPYLRLDKVEIWEATTNNRAAATKVGEIFGTQIARTGLARNVTRYYWVRARDVAGSLGEWYPESPTAGVSATTRDEVPPAGSVGPDQVQPNAINASKINVTDLSAISANLGTITAGSINGVTITGGTVRTAASGDRVVMSGTEIQVIPAGNTPVMLLRAIGSNTAFTVAWSLPSVALALFQNNSTGPAARFNGNGNNPAVVVIEQFGGTSAGNRALSARNAQAGGGHGYVGMPSGNGGYAFYSQSGGYGPFTGQHDAMIRIDVEVEEGDIVVDLRVLFRRGIDDTLTEVAVADRRGQKGVLGVVSRRIKQERALGGHFAVLPREDEDLPSIAERLLCTKFDRLIVNSVGEGQINVCGLGGDIEVGDLLIASTMRGKTEKQGDEIVYSYTVAKAREAIQFAHPNEVRLVACSYHCG